MKIAPRPSIGIATTFVLVGIGIHAPAAPAPVRPAASFEKLAARAEAARTGGRLEEAADLYQKAIGLRPRWAEGRLALAAVLGDLQRYPAARDQLQKQIAAEQGGGTTWAMFGLASSRMREYDQALAALGRAREIGIPSPELLSAAAFETALLLNRTGSHDVAFDLLRPLASEGRDTPTAIVAFGLCLLRMRLMPDEVPVEKREMVQLAGRGGYQMARPRRTAVGRLALEEVVSRYPSEPNVHYALGTYLAPDDPDAAAEEFKRELRSNPEHSEALIQLAHLETRRGNADAAVPYAQKAVELGPNVPAGRLVLGRALLDLERPEEAITQLERAVALAPDNADVHFALSRAYQRAGRTDEADREREAFRRLEKTGQVRDQPVGAAAPAVGNGKDRGGLN